MNWHEINESGVDVAVVGATGLVGELLLRLLVERRFPVRKLRLLASERSRGTSVDFGDRKLAVDVVCPEAFDGAQLSFFAASSELSKTLAKEAILRGSIVVDKSNTYRMDPTVPLIVPEVNGDALASHRGLIASPNCTTTGLVMALAPLHQRAGLRSVVATTLQAASGAGREGLAELEEQQKRPRTTVNRVFPRVLHRNVLPLCEALVEDGYSTEEHKLRLETRKILGLADLPVAVTAVRVPVPVGHSCAVLVQTERPLSEADARSELARFPGVSLMEMPRVPTPEDVEDSDQVLVGRVRRELDGGGLALFAVSNNLRKGAATNAIQIGEALLRRELLSTR